MNELEQRLRSAAEETRQLAQTRRPPKLGGKQPVRPRGLLVFAAAFAVVAVTFGLVPWLLGNGDGPPVADTTPEVTAPTVATTAPTVATTAPGASCSSDGVSLPAEAPDLPAAVVATRHAIAEAAAGCDLAALTGLAGENFTTSYGGGGAENLRVWEEEGTGQLGTLLQLLDMSYDTIEAEGQIPIYVWPAAARYEFWDDIPGELIAEIEAIHTDEELELMRDFGSYAGWRTGIDQDGNWLYFVAGD